MLLAFFHFAADHFRNRLRNHVWYSGFDHRRDRHLYHVGHSGFDHVWHDVPDNAGDGIAYYALNLSSYKFPSLGFRNIVGNPSYCFS